MWRRIDPIPFRDDTDCYRAENFAITCNTTTALENSDPPRPFLRNTTMEITKISLDGQLTALQPIVHACYNASRNQSIHDPWIVLPEQLTVNTSVNRFSLVGCYMLGYIASFGLDQGRLTGCVTNCTAARNASDPSPTGFCQVSVSDSVMAGRVDLLFGSFAYLSLEPNDTYCGYAFMAEEGAFSNTPENLTNLGGRHLERLPMSIDWAAGNETCELARTNDTSYACKSRNSECYEPSNGYGYRCNCSQGYHGNPYLVNGCEDVNECLIPTLNVCEKRCINTLGGFHCVCPKGYYGDGRKGGKGCIRGESLVYKLAAGIAIGVIGLLLAGCWLHWKLKRRILIKMRRKFFVQNGGMLLQEKLVAKKRSASSCTSRIFSSSELKKATKNFNSSMIIGQGGYGTVYKGLLPDNQTVAIKKSKLEVEPNQIEQFINEVIILTQINHRNVVKLLGCCLETRVPLLVYEFVSNGTLYEHLHHGKDKARALSWDVRLKIARETAGVLSYLHSSASTPIIHRDVKSANILLDHTFTAKVSDFGASKLVPLDHTQLSTVVQGTLGYLDPEYMQTNQLTEKSDVYSFGVVLVELLTGMKALSLDRLEEEMNLANYFLSSMRANRNRLFEIVADDIVREGDNEEQVTRVAELAMSCLNVRGDDRPSMKEVAMELEGLYQIHPIMFFLTTLLTLITSTTKTASFPIAKPDCPSRCGDVSIPYPFRTTPDCYRAENFAITCNTTMVLENSNPQRPFLRNTTMEITKISLDGQLTPLQPIVHACYNASRNQSVHDPWIVLPEQLTVNTSVNRFSLVGCYMLGYIASFGLNQGRLTGCVTNCTAARNASDPGPTGFCQVSVSDSVMAGRVDLLFGNFAYLTAWSRRGF
ncbi:Wall-associated receptor kinase 5 [Striga hermonthica]|uniref:Wall-associated receptor kinase 5 n=1 Tax=Striga hermonthica TaxID=68872 RepID=A0A9N7R939_STRHE|nr:Wall-associated receptor kinase 5 [Striga hermonthica]